eukprot:COSAG05_NODE_2043_length_3647_cov_2.893461_3_plen_162_part_00
MVVLDTSRWAKETDARTTTHRETESESGRETRRAGRQRERVCARVCVELKKEHSPPRHYERAERHPRHRNCQHRPHRRRPLTHPPSPPAHRGERRANNPKAAPLDSARASPKHGRAENAQKGFSDHNQGMRSTNHNTCKLTIQVRARTASADPSSREICAN